MVILKNKRTGETVAVSSTDPIVIAISNLENFKQFIYNPYVDPPSFVSLFGTCNSKFIYNNQVFTYSDIFQGNWFSYPDTELGHLLYGKR